MSKKFREVERKLAGAVAELFVIEVAIMFSSTNCRDVSANFSRAEIIKFNGIN